MKILNLLNDLKQFNQAKFWLVFLCSLSVAQAAPKPHLQPGVVKEEFVFKHAPFPECHAATILQLSSGQLLCAYFGGTRERAPDVCIYVSRHEHGHWLPPRKVATGLGFGPVRYPCWNPVLFQPRGGPVMLFYKVGPSPSQWWGMVKTSSDGGLTWSKARRLGKGLIGPVKDKPIQLADGTILAGSSTENYGRLVHVERSTDGGKTWKIIGPINPKLKIAAIQPTLLTYPDGRIQMLCRTAAKFGFIAQSWSKDEGLTWSPLAPTMLPNNDSGIDGVTLRDGQQLLVYNSSTRNEKGMGHKGRGFLNVAVSRDGIHWKAALVLDYSDNTHVQYSYPAVIQTHDGLVHIVYTWSRKRIKHVVLDPTRLVTTPMPDGKWPTKGPDSLAAFLRSHPADRKSD